MSDRIVKIISHILRDLIIAALAVLVIFATKFVLKAENGYEPGQVAEVYMVTDQDVVVESNMFSILFDGPGKERALLFYPADEVEEKAYAPMMYDLAKNGVDCIVAKMPLNRNNLDLFTLSDDIIMSEYGYKYWFIGGHGEGAGKAAEVAAKRSEKICGLICMAGFTRKDISDVELKTLMIHGTLDDIWQPSLFQKNAPANAQELPIVGGNYSQFGDFGLFEGDNMASISEGDQRIQSVEAIMAFVKANSPEPEPEYDFEE